MSKKNSIKKVGALLLGLALTAGATGCDFIKTDSMKDLAQTVATVNISAQLSDDDDTKDFVDDLQAVINLGGVETDIPKRDLVSYFMSVGYTYVQSYGYTYTDTFNMLLDMLVSRKIVTQYAVVYYLQKKDDQGQKILSVSKADDAENSCEAYIEKEKAGKSGKELELLSAHPEVSAMKYFLTENGAKNDLFEKVLYQMNSSINSTLDTAEKNFIFEATKDHDHGEVRTTPTNVNTEKEDFYIAPKVNGTETMRYEVYTGLAAKENQGVPYGYEMLEGSTPTTRMKAYNSFIGNLDENGLIKKDDNTSVLKEMDYYYVELASRLEQALIEKYTDDLIAEGEGELSKEYLSKRYNETKAAQQQAYEADASAFETAIDSLSDTNFVTYCPVDNYGFVYNILLPFSEEQNRLYAAEQARSTDDTHLYAYRAQLLSNIQAKDLRTSWFNEHEDENYAFEAESGAYYLNGKNSNYLFFEDNLTNNERYEELNVYYGQYPFNGTVTAPDASKSGKYELKSNVLTIDSFLTEMEGYLTYASGATITKNGVGDTDGDGVWESYVTDPSKYDYTDKKFNDYSQFIYYSGKVNVDSVNAANYFNPTTNGYKAAAAFNELMFAYSTDTGCLNTYMGYAVSPFTTSFVPEFEYAAQWAIAQGAGTYVVCPSTYGWHIIYVTYTYKAGDVYGGYNENDVAIEGTFSNMYAEAMKEQYSADYANNEQTRLILKYDNGTCVSRNQKTYQDLLDLDK
ncbi:MAG: hypothetical protein E7367_05280 [Clostridiales bacterium]|nr:hypothetical protein [Clostridiales bacterium]